MKAFKKILLFMFVLLMYPPVSFSQVGNTTTTKWILNAGNFGVPDTNTKTYLNTDGSRVFVSSGTPMLTPRVLVTAWYRIFNPTIKIPQKISVEYKLESGVNLDSVETFILLQDSLGRWTFYGAPYQPPLISQWQTLIWPMDFASPVISILYLQLSFQNRANSASFVRSIVFVKNIKGINADGSSFVIDLEVTTAVSYTEQIPSDFVLNQNYPNPFNPTTTIRYQLPVAGQVSLKIYDLLGREVATLVNEYQPAGTHEVNFLGRDLPSGMYIYRLQGKSINLVKKMMLMK